MSLTDVRDAIAIVDACLDGTGNGLLTGDYDLFAEWFTFPYISETFRGERVVQDREEMRRMFQGAVDFYRQNNVTDLARNVVAAGFSTPDLIRATHQTRLLSGTLLIKPPHSAFSEMRLIDGAWKVTVTRYAITAMPSLELLLGTDEDKRPTEIPTARTAKDV